MLTLDELEQIQAEALADDVEIDLARMRLWATEEARAYFESGGTVVPAPHVDGPSAVDPALATFLALNGLTSLAPLLACDSLAAHTAALRASGRPAFLATLKAYGIGSLTHRQSLATALAKADKAADGLGACCAADDTAGPQGRRGASAARPRPPPLPPHVRLTRAQLAALAPRTERGEWYGLPLPTSFAQLRGDSAWSKCPPWQRPSSAPAAPQGAPGGPPCSPVLPGQAPATGSPATA